MGWTRWQNSWFLCMSTAKLQSFSWCDPSHVQPQTASLACCQHLILNFAFPKLVSIISVHLPANLLLLLSATRTSSEAPHRCCEGGHLYLLRHFSGFHHSAADFTPAERLKEKVEPPDVSHSWDVTFTRYLFFLCICKTNRQHLLEMFDFFVDRLHNMHEFI